MRGQQLGSLIGSVFGLVYVLVNTGPLPATVAAALRVVGVGAFIAVVVALFVRGRARVRAGAPPDAPEPERFGRAYGAIVAIEAAALFGGLAIVNGVLDRPEAGVAWVSTVVGAHFFALARVFALRFFLGLGVVITACGVIGLGLAAAGVNAAPIAAISGVVPGLVLLGYGWWGATTGPTSRS